jgi:cytochrome b6-f complex iron-sulfur subunit
MHSRRNFIKKAGAISLSICAYSGLSSLLAACATTMQINSKSDVDGYIRVSLSSFEEGNSLLLNVEGIDAPIFLFRNSDTNFTAVLMVCTHKGCHLNKSGPLLVCPCHGSEFDRKGNVLSGPADENLLMYKTSLESDNILIKVK